MTKMKQCKHNTFPIFITLQLR